MSAKRKLNLYFPYEMVKIPHIIAKDSNQKDAVNNC